MIEWALVSRGRYIAIAGIACLVVGGFVAWQVFPEDEPTRATVGEAVERFRQAGAAGEGPGGAALGVYRYRTRGSETADSGLLSATHEYDGISTVTLTRSPCGVLERWQVLGGRWSEAEFCLPPNGTGLRAISEYHEFFGNSQESSYRCRGDKPSKRELRRVGTRFSSRCVSRSGAAESDSRVAEVEEVTVAGEPIEAVHTISNVVIDGEVSGSTRREDWRRRSDGLLLRREVEVDGRRSGTIDADYAESYEIELLSVEPRR